MDCPIFSEWMISIRGWNWHFIFVRVREGGFDNRCATFVRSIFSKSGILVLAQLWQLWLFPIFPIAESDLAVVYDNFGSSKFIRLRILASLSNMITFTLPNLSDCKFWSHFRIWQPSFFPICPTANVCFTLVLHVQTSTKGRPEQSLCDFWTVQWSPNEGSGYWAGIGLKFSKGHGRVASTITVQLLNTQIFSKWMKWVLGWNWCWIFRRVRTSGHDSHWATLGWYKFLQTTDLDTGLKLTIHFWTSTNERPR